MMKDVVGDVTCDYKEMIKDFSVIALHCVSRSSAIALTSGLHPCKNCCNDSPALCRIVSLICDDKLKEENCENVARKSEWERSHDT